MRNQKCPKVLTVALSPRQDEEIYRFVRRMSKVTGLSLGDVVRNYIYDAKEVFLDDLSQEELERWHTGDNLLGPKENS